MHSECKECSWRKKEYCPRSYRLPCDIKHPEDCPKGIQYPFAAYYPSEKKPIETEQGQGVKR